MRKLLALSLCILIAHTLFATPVYVGGSGNNCSLATTCSVTYTPTSTANEIIVCDGVSAGTTITVTDSLSNTLNASTSYTIATPYSALFFYTAPATTPITYTATYTGGTHSSGILVAEYANSLSISSGVTAHSVGGTQTVTTTALEANDVVAGCIASNYAGMFSSATGNLRLQVYGLLPSVALVDNTSTGATGTTTSTTNGATVSAWSAASLIMRPTASSGVNMVPFVAMKVWK